MLDDSGDKQGPEKNLVNSSSSSLTHSASEGLAQVMNSLTSTFGESLTSLQKLSTAELISANCGAFKMKTRKANWSWVQMSLVDIRCCLQDFLNY